MESGRWVLVALGLLVAGGTAASFSRHPHWSLRAWDFPRAQAAVVAFAVLALYTLRFFGGHPLEWAFLAAVAAAGLWQLRKIYPYTPLAPKQVERSRDPHAPRFRLLIANVLMENERHDLVLEVIRAADPDTILLVETDQRWAAALQPLMERYPHAVLHPRDNYYGMVLLSRLPLRDARLDFLVQEDIPSVHAEIELPGGERIYLHGLHPRPPEPIRDQDSTPRDAELVVVARAIGESEPRPTVVAGDLNDVAWSPTSELFLRLSGLLDPRVGRGMYSSFDARNPIFRYPLDHVFHSSHFRLVELRRLGKTGSDHFPMLVELALEDGAEVEQPEPTPEPGDHQEAEEKLERQEEAARTGEDRPRGE